MYRDKYNVDVLLFLEHKDRELEVIIEIAKGIKHDYGLSVAIASIVYHRINASLLVRPKVVVFPSYGTLMDMFYAMYGNGITYVNLNWEQMLSVFNKKYRKPRGQFARSILKHCAWGENFKEFLIENRVSNQNIFMTGKPSVTLLKKKSEKPSEVRSKIAQDIGIDSNKRWLFFPLTCLHAFKDDYHVKAYVNEEVTEKMAFNRRNYVSKTLNEIFRWIDSLPTENPDYSIVLRPHPSVSVSQYHEHFTRLLGHVPNNIIITKKFNAHDWLIAADACFTNYSSLALDAYSINKIAYLLEPEPFPDFLRYEWFKGFKRITSFKDFRKIVLDSGNLRTQGKMFLRKEFDTNLDGINETTRLLANLAKVPNKKAPDFVKLVKTLLKSPRQPMGSLIRFLFMKVKMSQCVRSGLQSDYFDNRTIVELLRSY